MPASSAAEGSKWKTTWLLGNKLRKPRYQPRSMTVEKVGDRGFVDADLEQRLDVRPVLGPIGQQLEDNQPLRADDWNLEVVGDAKESGQGGLVRGERHEVDDTDTRHIFQFRAEHENGRHPLEGLVGHEEVHILGGPRMAIQPDGKPADERVRHAQFGKSPRGLDCVQKYLGGNDFREAIPWIGQAGRPVNIGRPSAR